MPLITVKLTKVPLLTEQSMQNGAIGFIKGIVGLSRHAVLGELCAWPSVNSIASSIEGGQPRSAFSLSCGSEIRALGLLPVRNDLEGLVHESVCQQK